MFFFDSTTLPSILGKVATEAKFLKELDTKDTINLTNIQTVYYISIVRKQFQI